MEKIKVWWDREGDFLEVILDQKPGYFVETQTDQLMKKVDTAGKVIGFSLLNVSALKDLPPLALELEEEEERVEEIFHRAGAVLEGHFQLTSGLHSPVYWEKMRVLQHPELIRKLCRPIARHFAARGVEAVAGPVVGGAIIAYEVARQLGARAVYAEKKEEKALTLRQDLSPGERVLIVDDVLTTGGSAQQVIAAVRGAGGEVVGVAVAVDRSPAPVELGVPLFACHRASPQVYPPSQCPLCQAKVPLQKLGGGR